VSALKSQLLAEVPWLTHGFGTRTTEDWPAGYTSVQQIHSNKVVLANGRRGCLDQADALVSNEPGNLIGIRTADCVPILIVDPMNRVVAAVHAGWRGTVAEIAIGTVRRLIQEFNSDPGNLLAAIGPAIGPCCFEVGPEVAAQFQTGTLAEGHMVDLPEANLRQLTGAGLSPDHIDVMRLCTVCSGPNQFHSFRRDQNRSGRMVSAIGISFQG
jgi:polyphenol oxidase